MEQENYTKEQLISQLQQLQKQDELLKKQDKPQSRLEVLGSIEQLAYTLGDWSSYINSLVQTLEVSQRRDWRNREVYIETFVEKSNAIPDPVGKSVALTKSLDYMFNYSITNKNYDKIAETFNTIKANKGLLQKEGIANWKGILSGGDALFSPNNLYELCLINFLANIQYVRIPANAENITTQKRDDLFLAAISLIQECSKPGDGNFIHAAMARIDFLYNYGEDMQFQEYEKLIEEWGDNEAICETIIRKCHILLNRATIESPQKEESFVNIIQLCKNTNAKFPRNKFKSGLNSIVSTINSKNLWIDCNGNQFCPGDTMQLQINYKNLKSIDIQLFKVENFFSKYNGDYLSDEKFEKLKSQSQIVSRNILKGASLPSPVGVQQNIEYPLLLPEEATFLIYCASGTQHSYQIVHSAQLAFSYRDYNDKEIYVVDYKSGKPLEDYTINNYEINNYGGLLGTKIGEKCITNAKGFMPFEANRVVLISNGVNKSLPESIDRSYKVREPSKSDTLTTLFTDRKLYKPGEEIYFKIIKYTENFKGDNHVLNNHEGQVTLFDASGNTVEVKKFTTNNMGSFSGTFTIPQNSLNGTYRLKCAKATEYVRVEQYTRPNFSLTMEPVKEQYLYGSKIVAKGRVTAYNGAPTEGMKISYTIHRRPIYRFYFSYNYDEQLIEQGTTIVLKNGTFEIPFIAVRPTENEAKHYSDFSISITATDETGETHHSESSILVADSPLVLNSNFAAIAYEDSTIVKEYSKRLILKVENLSGERLPMEGHYRITHKDKVLKEGVFVSGEELPIEWNTLESGKLQICYTVGDGEQKVEKVEDFNLVSVSDKEMEGCDALFFANLSKADGDILIGTNRDTIYLSVECLFEKNILDKQILALPKGLHEIKLPYKDVYPDYVNVFIYGIIDRVPEERSLTLSRPRPIKEMNMRLSTLRESYEPNSKESISIELSPKEQASQVKVTMPAEVLLSIFDVTTDRFNANEYRFPHYVYNSEFYMPRIKGHSFDVPERYGIMAFDGSQKMLKQAANSSMNRMVLSSGPIDLEAFNSEESSTVLPMGTPMDDHLAETETEIDAPDYVRSNLDETIAFLPHLLTDENGKVSAEFTTTGLLSTFRVMLAAHTANMDYAVAEDKFVVKKEVMANGAFPGFLREGDEIVLQAKVSNISQKEILGKAYLSVKDAQTNKSLGKFHVQELTISPNGSEVASWNFKATLPTPQMEIKVWFESDTHTDGEARTIPVLSAKEKFTDTRVFVMQEAGSYSFGLDSLLKGRDGDVTVKVSTPLLSAFESLPYIDTPKTDNFTSWISALYATQMANSILSKNRYVRDYVENEIAKARENGWQTTLEKNQELTGILLSETPWLAASQLEKERLISLENYLKEGFADSISTKVFEKIKALQSIDGGFAWFKKMESSLSLTLLYLERIYQLQTLDAIVLDDGWEKINNAALNFVAKEFVDIYKDYKKYHKKGDEDYIGWDALQCMYVLGLYGKCLGGFPKLEKFNEGYAFYLGLCEKLWNKSDIIFKSLMANVLWRNGNMDCVKSIMESLSEYCVENSTIGCFFPNAIPFRSMLSNELRVHSHLLRLFKEYGEYLSGLPSNAGVEQMVARCNEVVKGIGQWLLLQKHNQQWDNDIATCDAVYALCAVSSNESLPECKVVTSVEKVQKGRPIKIEKGDNSLAFVSVFYNYFANVESVEAFSNGISVERKSFRAVVIDGEQKWVELQVGEVLNVGECVRVEYVIKSSENRKFVVLNAPTPASFMPKWETSGYVWQHIAGSYRNVGLNNICFYFYTLPEQEVLYSEEYFVTQKGRFVIPPVKVQSLYAPEYIGRCSATKIETKADNK